VKVVNISDRHPNKIIQLFGEAGVDGVKFQDRLLSFKTVCGHIKLNVTLTSQAMWKETKRLSGYYKTQ